jgi:uncharacterized damage-inducible protein DinB
MLLRVAAAIFDRDLQTLAREVEAYADERDLWRLPPGVSNSAGTLALHLAGNVQHYLGAVFGGTGYRRDRPAEFAERDVPRAELLRHIEAARAAVRAAAARADEEQLTGDFREVVGGVRVNAGEYLVHLISHFTYHLGQIDYHRRIITGDGRGVDAVRAAELSTARPVAD